MIHVLPSPFGDPIEFVSVSTWKDGLWSPVTATDTPVEISLSTNSLHYAGAIFEGEKATFADNVIYVFRLKEHYERFARGGTRLALPTPTYDMYKAGVEGALRKAKKTILTTKDLYIRPLIFANTNSCGAYSAGEFMFAVIVLSHTLSPGKLTKVQVELEDKRTWPGGLGSVKAAANYAAGRAADMRALDNGRMTLWTDPTNTYIQELTTASFMLLLKDGTLLSPEPDNMILDSITRRTILENAAAWGYTPSSQPLSIEKLRHWLITEYIAEAMQVGTAITALPIVEIALENKVYPISPFTYSGSAVEKIYTGMHQIYSTSNQYTLVV